MANDQNFVIKNGLQAGRYLQTGGTKTTEAGPAYDIGAAGYNDVSFSVASQDGLPYGLAFNNDGTKMYVVGYNGKSVYQYSLSTAFDLSTASYDSVSFSVSSQETIPSSVAFNSDGTKMYILGYGNDSVHQYTLSTAFDLSTASYDSVSFSVASQAPVPFGLAFNNDGTKMYVVGYNSDSVYQYSLSTAFDLSTASYDSVSFSVASQDGAPSDMTFNNNGTKMYVCGLVNDSIFQYTLSTAFDLSTASYDGVSVSVASQDTAPYGLTFNNDGTKMYVIGASNDRVYQYSTVGNLEALDLSTGTYFSLTLTSGPTISFTNAPASGKAVGFAVEINGNGSAITWPSSVKWHEATAPTATAPKEVYAFVTTDGGTTYYGRKAAEGLA